MAVLRLPSSTAVVDVPDVQVPAYLAQGWTDADAKVEPAKVAPEKPKVTRKRS